jgi:hypothetical protein
MNNIFIFINIKETKMMTHNGMQVTVKVSELLSRLEDNLKAHESQYNHALELWQEDFANEVDELEASSLDKFPQSLIDIQNSVPKSYAKEYERAIDMFEMTVQEEMTIDQDMFNQYCRDEWGWKHSTLTNKYYMSANSAI